MPKTSITCEVCGKELQYAGRGRPPTRCEEHKKSSAKANGQKESQMQPRSRPRPRPGQKPEPGSKQEVEKRERPHPQLPSVGKSDTQSRQKAESAQKRTEMQAPAPEEWPRGRNGRPMAKITFTASELVPTGQYANVSIGPAQVTAFVDLDREVDGEGYFSKEERETLAKSLNELAEVVEGDVVSVQRVMVLESMQEQLASD